jgi:hypothetical protein
MDEQTAIHIHLHDWPTVNGTRLRSSLIALRRDARGAAQRDLDTGEVVAGAHSMSWVGCIGYLILLDQIGTCFRLKGNNGHGDTAIVRAVHSFSDVKDQATLDVLYALRNALTHDFSLFNGHSDNPSRRHALNFLIGEDPPLVVRFPTRPWSGTYDLNNPPSEDEITVVNIRKVGDLAEGIVRRLQELNRVGGLELRPPMTVD